MRNQVVPMALLVSISHPWLLAGSVTTTELLKVLPADGVPNAEFGTTIAMDAGFIVIGAHLDSQSAIGGGAAYVYDAASGRLLTKFVAQDAMQSDKLGAAVAIEGSTVVAGATGPDAEAAYVFEADGDLIVKLTPDEEAKVFGDAVAIDGGLVAVGAWGYNGVGNSSGAAFLFDMSGRQLAKLVASEQQAGARFGWSVAMDGGVIAIGAINHDSTEPNDGAVFLFDIEGEELDKLVAPDPSASGSFGFSVAMNARLVVVGSPGSDGAGESSGAAYVFNLAGEQLFKLVPSDSAAFDQFGISVAIRDGLIVVGNYLDDDNGDRSGSVYFFDASSGAQLTKITPSDADSQDEFAIAVAIGPELVGVGAHFDDDNGNNAGSAYLLAGDKDRDGIFDNWETHGIDLDGDGAPELDLPAYGADPMRKDLFIEVDAMVGYAPDPAVGALLVGAFANAPVDNPDGSTGITLHLTPSGAGMVDESNIPVQALPDPWEEFDAIKAAHFGTPAEQGDALTLEAKGMVFRYCLFAQTQGGGASSGRAELPGDDFIVALGAGSWQGYLASLTPAAVAQVQAGTFMHELGHTLGLYHGGDQFGGNGRFNFKPNYFSVMNYRWQIPSTATTGWALDYSRSALPTLDEADLDEPAGIGGSAGISQPVGPPPPVAVPQSGPVDWDRDGDADDRGVSEDINRVIAGQPENIDMLHGHDDWAAIRLAQSGSLSFADGIHQGESPETELDFETFDELSKPPALCAADTDGNGVVNSIDLNAVLEGFGCTGGACPGDVTGDGQTDSADLNAVLGIFGQPCPPPRR